MSRQRKIEKKRKNRAAKTAIAANRRKAANTPLGVARSASRHPVSFCAMPPEAPEGIITVIFARSTGPGTHVLGITLLDLLCLGVKDSFIRTATTSQVREAIDGSGSECPNESVAPEEALGLIEAAAEWAGQFGFRPRGEFAALRALFSDIEPDPFAADGYRFGRDDVPVYIAGPNDNRAFQQRTLSQLRAAGIEDPLFVLPVDGDHEEEIDFEEVRRLTGNDTANLNVIDVTERSLAVPQASDELSTIERA